MKVSIENRQNNIVSIFSLKLGQFGVIVSSYYKEDIGKIVTCSIQLTDGTKFFNILGNDRPGGIWSIKSTDEIPAVGMFDVELLKNCNIKIEL